MGLDLRHYKNPHTLKSKVARACWNVVWFLLFRPTPQRGFFFFNAWRIFLLRLFGARIGRHCAVKSSVRVWLPWNLELGDYVALDECVNCYSVDKIRIGSSSIVSRETFLCCASHDITSSTIELVASPIQIASQVWLGARVIVLPGVTLGEGAVVAAGSVVTKDVASWSVVGGNPARFIKERILRDDRV